MDLTYVNSKEMKSIEDYFVSLVMGLLSLQTLREYHIYSMKLGSLSEEQTSTAVHLVWNFNKMEKMYRDQIKSIEELLPDTFNANTILEKFKHSELKRAKKMISEGVKNE